MAKYLRVICNGSNGREPECCSMSSIQVCLPDGLSYAAAKEYALAYITQEFERYGLGEALRGIGIEPPSTNIKD